MVCSLSNEQKSAIYLNLLKPMVETCLQKEQDRILAAKWIQILMSEFGTSELGKKYLKLLLFILPRKRLCGLFTDLPGTSFKELPEKVLDIALNMISNEEPSTSNLDNFPCEMSCPKHDSEPSTSFNLTQGGPEPDYMSNCKMCAERVTWQRGLANESTESCPKHDSEPSTSFNLTQGGPEPDYMSSCKMCAERVTQQRGLANENSVSTTKAPKEKPRMALPPLPPIKPPRELDWDCECPRSSIMSIDNLSPEQKRFFEDSQRSPSPSRNRESVKKPAKVLNGTTSPKDNRDFQQGQRSRFLPHNIYRVDLESQSCIPPYKSNTEHIEMEWLASEEYFRGSLEYIRRTLNSDRSTTSKKSIVEETMMPSEDNLSISTVIKQDLFIEVQNSFLNLNAKEYQLFLTEPLVHTSSSKNSIMSENLHSKSLSNTQIKNDSDGSNCTLKNQSWRKAPQTTTTPSPLIQSNNSQIEQTDTNYAFKLSDIFKKFLFRPSMHKISNLSRQLCVHFADINISQEKAPFNSMDESINISDIPVDQSHLLRTTINNDIANTSLPQGFNLSLSDDLINTSLPPGFDGNVSDEERLVQQMTAAANAIENESPNLLGEESPPVFFSDPSLHTSKHVADESFPSISSVSSHGFNTPPRPRPGGTPQSAHLPRPETHGLPSPIRFEQQTYYRPLPPRVYGSPVGAPVPRENWTRRRLNFNEQEERTHESIVGVSLNDSSILDDSIQEVSLDDSRFHPERKRRISGPSSSQHELPTRLPQPLDSPLTSTPDQNKKRSRRISFGETGYYSASPENLSLISAPLEDSFNISHMSPAHANISTMSSPRTPTPPSFLNDTNPFELSAISPAHFSPRIQTSSPLQQIHLRDSPLGNMGSIGAISPPQFANSTFLSSSIKQHSLPLISNITPPALIDDSIISYGGSPLEFVSPPAQYGSVNSPAFSNVSKSPIFATSPPLFASSPKSFTPVRQVPDFSSGSRSQLMSVTPPTFIDDSIPSPPPYPESFGSSIGAMSPPVFVSSPQSPPRPRTPDFPSGEHSLLMSITPPVFADESFASPPQFFQSFGSSIGAMSPPAFATSPQSPPRPRTPDFPSGERSLLMSVTPPIFADDSFASPPPFPGSFGSSIGAMSPPVFATSPKSPPRPRTPEFPSGDRSLLMSVTPPTFADDSFASPPPFPDSFRSSLGALSPPQFALSPKSPPRPRTPDFPSGERSMLMSVTPPTFADDSFASPPPFPDSFRSSLGALSPPQFALSPKSPPRPRTPDFPSGERSLLMSVTPPTFADDSFASPPPFPNSFRSSLGALSPPQFALSPKSPPRPRTPDFPSGERSMLMSVTPPTFADDSFSSPPPFPTSFRSSLGAMTPPQFASSPKSPPMPNTPDFPSGERSYLLSISPPVFPDDTLPSLPPYPETFGSSIGAYSPPSFASSPKTPPRFATPIDRSSLMAVTPPSFADYSIYSPPPYPASYGSPLDAYNPPSFASSPRTPLRPTTPDFPSGEHSLLAGVSPPKFFADSSTPKRVFSEPYLGSVSPPQFAQSPMSPQIKKFICTPIQENVQQLDAMSPPIFASTPPPISPLIHSRSPLWSQTPPSLVTSPQSPRWATPKVQSGNRSALYSATPPSLFYESLRSPLADVSPPAFYSSPESSIPSRARTVSLPSLHQSAIWSVTPPVFPGTPPQHKSPNFVNISSSPIMQISPPLFASSPQSPQVHNLSRSGIMSVTPPSFVDLSMGQNTPPFPSGNRSSILSGSPPVFTDITMGPQTPSYPAEYGSLLGDVSPPNLTFSPKSLPDHRSIHSLGNQSNIWSISPPKPPNSPPMLTPPRQRSPQFPNVSASPLANVSPPSFADTSMSFGPAVASTPSRRSSKQNVNISRCPAAERSLLADISRRSSARRSSSQPCISATSPPQFASSPDIEVKSSRTGVPLSRRSSNVSSLSPELIDDNNESIGNIPNYFQGRRMSRVGGVNLQPPIANVRVVPRTPWERTRQSQRIPITLDPEIAAPMIPYTPTTYAAPQIVPQAPILQRHPLFSGHPIAYSQSSESYLPRSSSILLTQIPLNLGSTSVSPNDSYNTITTRIPSYPQHGRFSPEIFDVSQPTLASLGSSYGSPHDNSRSYSISIPSLQDLQSESFANLFYNSGNASGTSFTTASGGIVRPRLRNSFSDYSGEFLSDVQPVDFGNISFE